MRLSESDNVLIMSAIFSNGSYTESLTHSEFSSPYPSLSRAVCHVTVSSVVEFHFSLTTMRQLDPGLCGP